MRKVWIVGSKGQIGKAVLGQLNKLDFEIMETDIDEVDVSNVQNVMDFGDMTHPDVIIDCVGLTDHDECERDRKKAYLLNAITAKNLSILAKKLNCKIVYLSSDDVFDGKDKEAYSEFDATNPQSVYGKSKLAGENYVKEFTTKHFIIRSSWVYGIGKNFISYIINEAKTKKEVVVANDQYASPTSADELSKFIVHLISSVKYGTYHATCTGICSRYEFAKKILALTGSSVSVKGIPSDQTEYSSKHPTFATLENFVMELEHNYDFPSWEEALEDYMKRSSE